ncbi:hypothetical protein CH92_01515 [Stutzerimonas stutzeri]|uniref:Uncharacterized protein n=1 Tax=Stutzerimonas stutzeri TaxID=316 RepID=W8RCY4_STUST|nr:hypothetical protein CH92_01515 [Stutzerimonas stutzeri]
MRPDRPGIPTDVFCSRGLLHGGGDLHNHVADALHRTGDLAELIAEFTGIAVNCEAAIALFAERLGSTVPPASNIRTRYHSR